MDNKIKSKTRLAAIQLVSQQLVNNQDIESIKDDFDKYYRNTTIDNIMGNHGNTELNAVDVNSAPFDAAPSLS